MASGSASRLILKKSVPWTVKMGAHTVKLFSLLVPFGRLLASFWLELGPEGAPKINMFVNNAQKSKEK